MNGSLNRRHLSALSQSTGCLASCIRKIIGRILKQKPRELIGYGIVVAVQDSEVTIIEPYPRGIEENTYRCDNPILLTNFRHAADKGLKIHFISELDRSSNTRRIVCYHWFLDDLRFEGPVW